MFGLSFIDKYDVENGLSGSKKFPSVHRPENVKLGVRRTLPHAILFPGIFKPSLRPVLVVYPGRLIDKTSPCSNIHSIKKEIVIVC